MKRILKLLLLFWGITSHNWLPAQAWIQATSPTTSTINDISFFTADIGWMVGSNGTIAKYENQTWQIINSPTNFDLITVQPVDTNSAWILGNKTSPNENKILFYDNGTFFDYSPSINAILSDLHMINGKGWSAGSYSYILYFDGSQWIDTTAEGFDSKVWDIDFHDTTGFMVGEFPNILTSSNGFQDSAYSWTCIHTSMDAVSDTSCFVARKQAFPGGGFQSIHYYPDNISVYYSTSTSTIEDINFFESAGWAVDRGGKILRFDTTNFQFFVHQTWPSTALLTVEMTSDTSGWIGGEYGNLLKLTDSQITVEETEVTDDFILGSNIVINEISFMTLQPGSQLEIFDLNGRLCYSTELHQSGLQTMDISQLKSGSYLLLLSGNETFQRSRFVKVD